MPWHWRKICTSVREKVKSLDGKADPIPVGYIGLQQAPTPGCMSVLAGSSALAVWRSCLRFLLCACFALFVICVALFVMCVAAGRSQHNILLVPAGCAGRVEV